MGVAQIHRYEYSCDLCPAVTLVNMKKLPSGWIHIVRTSEGEVASDSVVCSECVKVVVEKSLIS